jgi:polysaccharide export outer membrane protein
MTGSIMAQTLTNNGRGGTNDGRSTSPSLKAAPVASGTDYVIGPDDVLAVNVWKEPDLSRSVLVRPDGKITLPLLKDIEASGSTPDQLQARIEKGLSEFISKPSVTVIVQEAKSHKFNILGAVQKPGTYILTGPLTVLDAIALAGGFREWAKVKSIYILRENSSGSRQKIPFNYKKVVKGSTGDIPLQTKDTIVVP